MGPPSTPRLTGDAVQVTQRLQTTVACPQCSNSLDITDVKVGATIECPDCNNVTWAPEYVARWWHRARNFAGAVTFAFVVGFLASLAAAYAFDWMPTGGVQGAADSLTGGN